jgi:hypothetical protein
VGLTPSSKVDSPHSTPPARPLRSMQTGQNSIAPENSLPQLGQVRWGSVLIVLTLPSTHSEPRKKHHACTERCEIGQHGSLANCCPVSQAIASSFRVARHIAFRNRIPIAGVLRHRARDNDLRRWLRSIKPSMEVTLKPFSKSNTSVLVLILINETHFCEDRDIPKAILNH